MADRKANLSVSFRRGQILLQHDAIGWSQAHDRRIVAADQNRDIDNATARGQGLDFGFELLVF